MPDRRKGPQELIEPSVVTETDHSPGVGQGSLDLEPVADDARVGQKALIVSLAERCDGLSLEPGKGSPKALTFAQVGEPGQPRLERLERQALVELGLAMDGHAPLFVVIGHVVGRARGPATAGHTTGVDHEALTAQGCSCAPPEAASVSSSRRRAPSASITSSTWSMRYPRSAWSKCSAAMSSADSDPVGTPGNAWLDTGSAIEPPILPMTAATVRPMSRTTMNNRNTITR